MATTDVPQHWALALSERCRRYNVLPSSGGAYDQDEYIMMAMEQASGANTLFDADSRLTMKFIDLHTKLGEEAAAIIKAVNEREQRENVQSQS